MNASEPREDAVAGHLIVLRVIRDAHYMPDAFKPSVDAAIAALAQQGAEPVAWRPIETAPENVEVWLFDPDTDPHQYAALLTERDPSVGGFYWRPAETLVAEMLDYELRPTHWQPLPAAPSAGAPR